MGVGNLARIETCPIHTQWGLELVSVEPDLVHLHMIGMCYAILLEQGIIGGNMMSINECKLFESRSATLIKVASSFTSGLGKQESTPPILLQNHYQSA